MCTIDKMLIKGIRSFSPNNDAAITFYKPLTLVVGTNGAGKTTIIECLKHACTGELPPNAGRGHTFVHDPKIAGESEVKGQIKLRFYTITGSPVMVIRSVQLTQKASKMEFKALEGFLQTKGPDGERRGLPAKCADMDREVPKLMGVSKAVLENVIFVHQDDSNWPLADPATLKTKFDDIFSATRYTKALDNIKSLKKDYGANVREFRLKLEHLQTVRDQATNLRQSLEADQKTCDEAKGEIQVLERSSEAKRLECEGLNAVLNSIQGHLDEMRRLQMRKEVLIAEKAAQRQNVKDPEDVENPAQTLEALEGMRVFFEDELVAAKGKVAEFELKIRDKEIECKAFTDQLSMQMGARGRLEQAIDDNKRNEEQLGKHIKGVSDKHNIQKGALPPIPYSPDVVASFLRAAGEKVAYEREALGKLKDQNYREHHRLSQVVDAVSQRHSAAEGRVRLKQEQQQRHSNELQATERRLESLAGDAFEFPQLEQLKEKLKGEVARKQKAVDDPAADQQLRTVKRELGEAEARREDIQREKDRLVAQQLQWSLLEAKSDEAALKRRKLEEAFLTKKARIVDAIGEDCGVEDLGRVVKRLSEAHDAKEAESHRQQDKLNGVKASFKVAENSLAKARKQKGDADASIARLRQELQGAIQRDQLEGVELPPPSGSTQMVGSSLSSQPADAGSLLDDAIRTARESLREAEGTVTEKNAIGRIVDKYLVAAKRDNKCHICERGFHSDSEKINFIDKYEMVRNLIPQEMEAAAQRREAAAAKVRSLEQLRPKWVEYERLLGGVCQNEEAIRKLEAELADVREQEQKLASASAAFAVSAQELFKLRAELRDMESQYMDWQRQAGQLARQREEMGGGDRGQGEGTSLADRLARLTQDLEELAEKKSNLQFQRDRQERLRDDKRAELDAAQRELNLATERLRRAEDARRERDALAAKRDELAAGIQALAAEIQAAAQEIAPLAAERDAAVAERVRMREEAAQSEDRVASQLAELERDLQPVDHLQGLVVSFRESGKPAELERVQAMIAGNQRKRDQLAAELATLQEELKTQRESEQSYENYRRAMEDMIKYKRTLNEIESLDASIKEASGRANEQGDPRMLRNKCAELQREIEDLRSRQDKRRGLLSGLKLSVEKNEKELKQPQFKNIDDRHKHQLIELKTTEMAIKDLDKYYNALDKALMAYHGNKMAEINKIIHELWQKTYQGQDIESIAIRSDQDTAGKRSYNYRVVMKSGDAELDMRGRCSAGQKVLACLVIRMALAETFCLNCGILALDEPTTNLDKRNAESLALALRSLMEHRREQENFQLIVITHDEVFAGLIGKRDYTEKYWRISKDEK
eukprot:jgi/Mesvir1/7467/Mv19232-RA.2